MIKFGGKDFSIVISVIMNILSALTVNFIDTQATRQTFNGPF